MKKLTTGESHRNETSKNQIVNIRYLNCFNEYQTSQKILEPGNTFTKNEHSTIVFIEQLN
jgi:hypothetical protein